MQIYYYVFSQLWPTRFSKACNEMVEDHDEWELYKYWKKISKGMEKPQAWVRFFQINFFNQIYS